MGHVEKLDLRFLQIKTEIFLVSGTYLILRFAIVQNKFQQTNKNNKKNMSMTITSSLRFLYILGGSGLLCGKAQSGIVVVSYLRWWMVLVLYMRVDVSDNLLF